MVTPVKRLLLPVLSTYCFKIGACSDTGGITDSEHDSCRPDLKYVNKLRQRRVPYVDIRLFILTKSETHVSWFG